MMIRNAVIVGIFTWGLIVYFLSGCGVSVNAYRIDRHSERHEMQQKSWGCILWNSCESEGGNSHGS